MKLPQLVYRHCAEICFFVHPAFAHVTIRYQLYIETKVYKSLVRAFQSKMLDIDLKSAQSVTGLSCGITTSKHKDISPDTEYYGGGWRLRRFATYRAAAKLPALFSLKFKWRL